MTEAIAYSSPFVPAEWIAAHGFRPTRVRPGPDARSGLNGGVCPFASAHLDSTGDCRAAIFTTTCDQMRRGSEEVDGPPVFLMNVPHTWGRSAHRLYADELSRLARFLIRLGGREPTRDDLVATLRRYDAGRERLRQARGLLSGRAWAEAAGAFFESGDPDLPIPKGPQPRSGVPLALVGVPLWGTHTDVYEWIEAAGGEVVLDGTETGERALPAPLDRRRLAEDPRLELADAYFGAIPDAFRRPNSELYRWLERGIAERGVRGLLFLRCTWCDLWHAERARLAEWSRLPVVELDLTGEGNGRVRAETRIEALLDMVR